MKLNMHGWRSACHGALVVVYMGAVIGCAANPTELFPKIYEEGAQPDHISLVVDMMLVSNAEESDLGVNIESNLAAARTVEEFLSVTLADAGYAVNSARVGYGLTYEVGETPLYLVSDANSGLGPPYQGPQALAVNDRWVEEDARAFLKTLQNTAKTRRTEPESASLPKLLAALQSLPRPAAFADVQSRYILLANVFMYEVSAAQRRRLVASYFMPDLGLTTALLKRTPWASPSTLVELILFDTETSTIAWSSHYLYTYDDTYHAHDLYANEYFGSGFDEPHNLMRSLRIAISSFPAHLAPVVTLDELYVMRCRPYINPPWSCSGYNLHKLRNDASSSSTTSDADEVARQHD